VPVSGRTERAGAVPVCGAQRPAVLVVPGAGYGPAVLTLGSPAFDTEWPEAFEEVQSELVPFA